MRQIHSGFPDNFGSLLYASSGAIGLPLCAVEERLDPLCQASTPAANRTVRSSERCDRQSNGSHYAQPHAPGPGETASFRCVARRSLLCRGILPSEADPVLSLLFAASPSMLGLWCLRFVRQLGSKACNSPSSA